MTAAGLLAAGHRRALSRREAVAWGAASLGIAVLASPSLHAERPPVLLADLIAGRPELSVWWSLVRTAGLARLFRGIARLTAFVPADDVFTGNPDAYATLRRLDAAGLRRFVLSHLVAGAFPLDLLAGLDHAASLAGTDIAFDASPAGSLTASWDDGRFAAATTITTLPLQAGNGLLYELGGFVLSDA